MALAKTSNGIISIRGRFGGTYFKTTGGIIQQQAMPRHVYNTFGGTVPPIEHHSLPTRWKNIYAFTKSSRAFFYLAAIGVISGFGEIAEYCLYPTKSGTRKKLAAYHWWQHYNTSRMARDLPPYTIPPKSLFNPPNVVITGNWWGKNTLNMYMLGVYHGGKPIYEMQLNPWWWQEWYILHENGIWYITNEHGIQPPATVWYNPTGEITGEYIPINPEQGMAFVDF